MTSFFRFLSKRGPKTAAPAPRPDRQPATDASAGPVNLVITNNLALSGNKHMKLSNRDEDLKESIQHYNQRCHEIQQQRESGQHLDKLKQVRL